jgi:WW domain
MSAKSAYDAFASVDQLVAKPVLGSDGAASWQEFRKETKIIQRESTAPGLQIKRSDRLGTGFRTLEEERENENKVRMESGESAQGSGYTSFKRKQNSEEVAQRKQRRLAEKRIRPDKIPYFITSQTFIGYKFDYIFTTRDGSTGYYWDGMDSYKKVMGLDISEELIETTPNNENAKTISSEVVRAKKKVEKKKLSIAPPSLSIDSFNPREQVANAIRLQMEQRKRLPPNFVDLPEGWETALDPSSGKEYYFHRLTNQKQWERPEFDLPEGWKSAKDVATGKTYYYHSNGETRWTKP